MLEAGRDLRPDTITPGPDVTSTEADAAEHVEELLQDEDQLEIIISPAASEDESAPAVEATSASGSDDDNAASSGGDTKEKQDASSDAAE